VKITKQQLKQIIKEELDSLAQEEYVTEAETELEEGFFDKLFGKSDASQDTSTEQEDVTEFIIDAGNALKQLMRVAGKQARLDLQKQFEEIKNQIESLSEPLKQSAGQKIKPGEFKTGMKKDRIKPSGISSRPAMVFEKSKK
jgi:hypothetical protein